MSGYLWNRPSFDRLKQDVDDGLIEGIIIKDLSRLSRHSARAQLYVEELTNKEIELISILKMKTKKKIGRDFISHPIYN